MPNVLSFTLQHSNVFVVLHNHWRRQRIRNHVTMLTITCRRKLLAHSTISKMALASVLNSDCEDLSFGRSQTFSNTCGAGHSSLGFDATPGDGLSFLVKNSLSDTDDGVERKIEFLHGTTTLAFKVSVPISTLSRFSWTLY